MPRIAAVALGLALALTGCSEGDAERAVDEAKDSVQSATDDVSLPEVNWEKHGREVKQRLDGLVAEADCSGLRKELGTAEKNDAELTRYIKAQIRQAC
jgi:PBP1b-binding outer membrane lipoprotein LpoB